MAKSRLAGALPKAEREALVRGLLRHVLATVRRAAPRAGLAGGIVVSRDPGWLALAAHQGFLPLVEVGPGGLNAALAQAVRAAARRGAGGALILPLDLPLLSPADVVALAARLPRGRGAVIAPDRAGTGTNALLMRPATLMPPAFGPDSAGRHAAMARQRGAAVHVVRRPGLAQDLDRPGELTVWSAARRWTVGADIGKYCEQTPRGRPDSAECRSTRGRRQRPSRDAQVRSENGPSGQGVQRDQRAKFRPKPEPRKPRRMCSVGVARALPAKCCRCPEQLEWPPEGSALQQEPDRGHVKMCRGQRGSVVSGLPTRLRCAASA